ncbi:MAG: FAD/NAD(P)-binding protein [Acetobacteraceae bacterium]|nr:FAD/NAD(P)-binding protein [Acetobacteraceae bacterium]
MHEFSIAVIGAGFSGTMLSLGLQASCPRGTRIHLIERSGRFGPGLAYNPADAAHLLNVPAGRMSAFPDRPLDFLHWLQSRPDQCSPTPTECAFVSRALYGAYLQDRLHEGLANRDCARLVLHHDRVEAVHRQAGGVQLQLASGHALSVDVVVLAMGNDAPLPPIDATALQRAGLWRVDPWSAEAFGALDPATPVLLIGTGLTMVDAVVSLTDAGHRGPIHALSRRGLVPQAHLDTPAPVVSLQIPLPRDPVALLRRVRQEIARAMATGLPWQPVIDALRPHTQALWRGMGPLEQARFLRHARPWWDMHRHRMAPEIAERIQQARATGQLRIHAGRITDVAEHGGQATVMLRPRGTRRTERLVVGRVVNCTGPGSNVTHSADPLIRALLRDGMARPDPLRLGLDVTEDCAVVARNGMVSRQLFAMGPLTKGVWWEITAVPDIRCQCQQVAQTIGSMIGLPAMRHTREGAYRPAGGQPPAHSVSAC